MSDLQYKGFGCFELKTKTASILIDPLESVAKSSSAKDLIIISTDQDFESSGVKAHFVISTPGEFEISQTSVKGLSLGPGTGTIAYRIVVGGSTIGLLGAKATKELRDELLELLGFVDYLIMPIGGGDQVSIDSKAAAELVQALEPRAIIPSYFALSNVKGTENLADIAVFAKEIGKEPIKEPKIKIDRTLLGEDLQLFEPQVA